MIREILTMLNNNEHYNKSELIEIAKGKYQLQSTIKGGIKQFKRLMRWQKLK